MADKRGRYAAVLLACASLGDEGGLDKPAREVLVVNLVVLAHHPAICTFLLLSMLMLGLNVIGSDGLQVDRRACCGSNYVRGQIRIRSRS